MRLQREARSVAGLRPFADRVFSRAAGAPLISGNTVRLLIDANDNYPAWLDAIRAAKQNVHFESFIIHEDEVGREFADALIAKARQGVRVRVLYDWLGAVGKTSRRFWRRMRDEGVEVRGFNPPRIDSPFGWLSRDHRKSLTVDHQVAFVTGLCVGRAWVGDPKRGLPPWRDTGVEIRGPAVADVVQAFAHAWEQCGPEIPHEELPHDGILPAVGDVALRVIASTPYLTGLYRLDQFIAAAARRTLWLTDAYYLGTSMYVQSLRAAAQDGVDVRLLLPGESDIQLIAPFSRAGYRPLLEAGVRVFEWKGSMLHAKTAVADGQWARVGSSNLNMASWIGNWELDVAVEDADFARRMEEQYLVDLSNATEVVLSARRRVHPLEQTPRRMRRGTGKGGRVAAAAISVGKTVGAAIADRRTMGAAEAKVLAMSGLLLLGIGVLAWWKPRALAAPLAVLALWTGIALLIRALRLRKQV